MNLTLLLKSFLSKLNFLLGNNPRLLKYPKESLNKFIPPGYKAVLIISCDFELIWAWRFTKRIKRNLQEAREIAKRERENIPLILELCERFNIPITWAIVGHLFLESCSRENRIAHQEMPRPGYFENKYWRFSSGDWFDADPCCNWQEALEWYAPDLIGKILNSKVKHEIACHTFSHIDCRQKVCPKEILKKEILKCKELASKYKVRLESFIFPGNFIGNLAVLKEEGFTAYRVDKNVLGFPQKDNFGLWQVPTSAAIDSSIYKWDLDYFIKRYITIIERAIKYQRLCHFWFHPSVNIDFLNPVLTALFEFVNTRRELYLTTIKGYCKYLENGRFE